MVANEKNRKMRNNSGINAQLMKMVIYAGVILSIVFTAILFLQSRQARMLHEKSKAEYIQDFNSLIKYHSIKMTEVILDYTHWDEFSKAMEKGVTQEWFDYNLSSLLEAYDLDYVAIYDKSLTLQIEYSIYPYNLTRVIPASALLSLSGKRYLNCFTKTEAGYLEYVAAPIHHQTYKKGSPPPTFGYFVLGKLWNNHYVSTLANSLNSSISLVENTSFGNNQDNSNYLQAYYQFLDHNGSKIGGAWFSKEDLLFKLYKNSSSYLIFSLLLFFVIMWLVFMQSIKKLMIRPLSLVRKILEREEMSDVDRLIQAPAEFSDLGHLFKRYIFQKGDLKKEKERAERADKLKTQFIANMSHEIRTPMNGIIGFTELLKDDSLSREEKDKYIGIIQNSGQRMISILNDLIKISMLDSEQESVNILPVSLNGLCHNVRTFFKMDTEKKGITMICSQEMEKDLVVYTDRDKLYAIVNNLVKNAIKYSSGGVIEFSYQIDNGFIQFNIKDQGIGIEKELQEKIFDRFYQVDSNLNKQYDGVGLGLAIVKSYTELLGGKIWVESSLGKGSTFSFTIPYSQMFS